MTNWSSRDRSLSDAILDGVTLETVAQVVRPTMTFTVAPNGQVTFTTDGIIQVSDNPAGPYTSLVGGTVTVDPKTAGSPKFYRGVR